MESHHEIFSEAYEDSPIGAVVKEHVFYDVETPLFRVLPGMGRPDVTWTRWMWNLFN